MSYFSEMCVLGMYTGGVFCITLVKATYWTLISFQKTVKLKHPSEITISKYMFELRETLSLSCVFACNILIVKLYL